MTFTEAIKLGFTRCRSSAFLDVFNKRWETEIQQSPDADEIGAAYRARLDELRAEEAKARAEAMERRKWEPRGSKRW